MGATLVSPELAEAGGDRTPDGVQDSLSRVNWHAVGDDLRAHVTEYLGDPGAVPVVDEAGFSKEGTKSAGVRRQYTGTAGRIENAQVGLSLGYASRPSASACADAIGRLSASLPPAELRSLRDGSPRDGVR